MYNQLRIVMPQAACNLSCQYCVIGHDQDQPCSGSVAELDEAALRQAIDGDFKYIGIWGGEPLANQAAFVKVVEFCKQNYPQKPIGIVTNGYLINSWWVDFFNAYGIDVTISHDGPGQQYRHKYDLLGNSQYRVMLNKIKTQLAFNSVIHHDNCNIEDIVKYFEQIQTSLDKEFGWHFEHLKVSSPGMMRFVPHGSQIALLQTSYRWLLQQVVAGRALAISAIGTMLVNLAKKYEQNTYTGLQCSAQKWLTVDTLGKKHFCQVACENGLDTWPEQGVTAMCVDCSYCNVCTGICPHIPDRYRKKLCIVYKLWFYEVDRLFVSMLLQEEECRNGLLLSNY